MVLTEVVLVLFKKKIEPCCSWCRSGVKISDTEVACIRRGIVSSAGSCRKFKYDPLKRDPPVTSPLKTGGLTEEDFTI